MANTKIPVELSSTPGIVDNSNATAITIDSSQRVGIGTSPSNALDVQTSAGKFSVEALGGGSVRLASNGSMGMNVAAGFSYEIDVGGSEVMRIDSSGNVGIGTTSGDVFGRFYARSVSIDSSGVSKLQINSATGQYAGIDFGVNGTRTADINSDTSSLNINTIGSIPMTFITNGTERMRIHSSGCVGVGSTVDRSLGTNIGTLVVNGSAGGGLWLSTGDSSATTSKIISTIDGSVGDLLINQGSGVNGGNIRFSLNDSEKMRILSSGTLLVSTTTTSGLSNGTSNYGHSFGGGQQVNATNNDTNIILNMSNGSSNPHVQFRSDGGNTGNISTNGSAVSYNASSDYRLKENVIPLKDGLDRLNKLNPVQFDWKKSQETDEGFIAHEVQEIVPYVVKGEKDGEEIQTMDYGKLTPLLVKAIQEQQAQIDALQSEINLLKGE